MNKTGVTLARHSQKGATLAKVMYLVRRLGFPDRDPSVAVSLRLVSSGWGGRPVRSCAWLRTVGKKPQG